jgi:hypothetical protein
MRIRVSWTSRPEEAMREASEADRRPFQRLTSEASSVKGFHHSGVEFVHAFDLSGLGQFIAAN